MQGEEMLLVNPNADPFRIAYYSFLCYILFQEVE